MTDRYECDCGAIYSHPDQLTYCASNNHWQASSRHLDSEGANRIAHERQRQIAVEGWTAEHDDELTDGSLALEAVSFAAPVAIYQLEKGGKEWALTFRQVRPKSRHLHVTRIRRLEIAGALIAAEIDRLLRAEEQEAQS